MYSRLGGRGGRAWGGDLTCISNMLTNCLLEGKSFQSNNAQTFPHPGYPRLSRSSGIGAPMRINVIWISLWPLGPVYKEGGSPSCWGYPSKMVTLALALFFVFYMTCLQGRWHLGIFWVGMCRLGLQIGTPF